MTKEKKNRSNHFENYYVYTESYCQGNRHIDQWNQIENSEIAPCKQSQLIFVKVCKANQWRQYIVSSPNGAETIMYP